LLGEGKGEVKSTGGGGGAQKKEKKIVKVKAVPGTLKSMTICGQSRNGGGGGGGWVASVEWGGVP